MVASLEEAFGIRSFKKKKSCKKDFEKAGFKHYDNTNVYNQDKYYDDNTNINSNNVYQDRAYYPHRRPMKRNRIPKVLLEQDNDNPIKLGNVPIEMGAGDEPSDGDYAYAPGSQAENDYLNYSQGQGQGNNKEYLKYVEEQEGDYIEEGGEYDYDSKEPLVEGMVDYQTFERGFQRSIEDLTTKVNSLLSGSAGAGASANTVNGDPLSNTADVVLYIFTGIFFLFLFDMAFKMGKLKR
jgi:hypothetical protein